MHQIESFFLGIIAALGALVAQLLLYIAFSTFFDSNFAPTFEQAFSIPYLLIAGAFSEELFKYFVISKRVEMFSLSKSYIVNSILVGLGFLFVEIGLIFFSSSMPSIAVLTEIAIIHVGTAGIIGYIVATKNPKGIGAFLTAMILVTTIHASFNYLIMHRNFILNYFVYILLIAIVLLNVFNFARISGKLARG